MIDEAPVRSKSSHTIPPPSTAQQYSFPNGHLGHLTAQENEALGEFKELLIRKKLYEEGDGETRYSSYSDGTLLRFLRARRFNVEAAGRQFEKTTEWREANQIDELYKSIDIEQFDETRKLYTHWTGRRDRRGVPVYVFEIGTLTTDIMEGYEKSATSTYSKAKTDGKTPQKLLRLFAGFEHFIRFVMPLCTAMADRQYPDTPITQTINIVDISGVGLKQFWSLRGHLQDASALAASHYPETLDRIFVIGAPGFFPTVLSWIKRFFDPITASKILILGEHDVRTTLEEFIDPANIPQKYGGELNFEFGQAPMLDPVIKHALKWHMPYEDLPLGPLLWEEQDDCIVLKAVGSLEERDRTENVATLQKVSPNRDADID